MIDIDRVKDNLEQQKLFRLNHIKRSCLSFPYKSSRFFKFIFPKVPSLSVLSHMALSNKYTEEQLNYFRICYVTTDIIAEGLRELFKREWDNQYKSTPLGEWKDVAQNGTDFYNGESPRNQRRNARLLATMINGNRAEWDCTMLFYAILYSDCVGPYLASTVRNNVENLRNFRNEEFAHISLGSLPEMDFRNAIGTVHVAFHALGLSTVKIDEIKNQNTFPTDELHKILKEVDDVKQELQEKEKQRQVLENQLQKKKIIIIIMITIIITIYFVINL